MTVRPYPERGAIGGNWAGTSVPSAYAGAIITVNGVAYAWNGSAYAMIGTKDAANQNTENSISINDLILEFGDALDITSPYDLGTPESNTLMHPTIIRHSRGVDGSPYLMVTTPFAGANDDTENPCIYVSDDLLEWRVPAGVTNPIFPEPSDGGYNSDCHIYEHTDGYTYLAWRKRTNGTANVIYGSRSYDCIAWSSPVVLFTAVDTVEDWASPSFWHNGTDWVLVAHNIVTANAVRRYIKSGDFLASWGAVSPTTITPTHPNSLSWWHSDIRRLPNGRLVSLALEGGVGGGIGQGPGGGSAAWLWQSDNDGTNWSVRQLTRGKINYRSSLVIDGSTVAAVLTWVEADADGTPVSASMSLHRLRQGRRALRRQQAVTYALTAAYSLSIQDEQNLIAHADGFTGTAADLAAPWVQNTATAMRRNGSGVAVAANTTNPAFPTVETGSPDHGCQAKIVAYAGGSATMYVVTKFIDDENYAAVGIADSSGKLAIKAIVADVTVLDEAVLATPSLSINQIIRTEVDGLWLRAYIDGIMIWEGKLPAALAAGTKAGLYTSGSTGNQFDEFAAWRL